MPGQLVKVMVEVQLAEIFVVAGSRGVPALGATNSSPALFKTYGCGTPPHFSASASVRRNLSRSVLHPLRVSVASTDFNPPDSPEPSYSPDF